MKAQEIRSMSSEELMQKLDEAYHELLNLRFQLSRGQLEDTNRIREVKRDIARIKTILRERELWGSLGGGE